MHFRRPSTVTTIRLGAAAILLYGAPAGAQTRSFDISPMPLGQALRTVGTTSGTPVIFTDDLVHGKTAPRIHGRYSADAAIALLLVSSGLVAAKAPSGAIMVARSQQDETALTDQNAPVAPGGQFDPSNPNGDIIVTATKSRQRLIDVPASVSAETGEQLRRRGATQLQDIIATTPGLSNPGPGGSNNVNLVIRGVTTDTSVSLKQSTVSVLFDDIPVDPATSGLLTTNLRIVDIERVEVLRGPQGTLFGSGSLSGAIRYVTNKPDMTRVSGSIEGTLTGTNGGADSQWGNAVLNVPIVADRVAVRAVGYGYNEGGWIDNIATGKSNVNRNKTYGGRIAVAAQATDRFLVTLTGAYQNSHDYAGNDSLYDHSTGYDKQVTTNRIDRDSYAESTLANLGLRYDFGSVSAFSSSTYIHRKALSLANYNYYVDLLQAQLGLPPVDDAAPGRTFNSSNIFSQELRLASNGNGSLRWTIGGFYLRANTPNGGQTITSAGVVPYLGTSNLITFQTPGRQEEIAGFGEVTYTIAHKLDLTAGARVSRTTLNNSSIASGILISGSADALPAFNEVSRQTTVNPRFSVLYHASNRVSLYAQAARGYRVGGANVTAVLAGPGVPTTYGSDHLWNYETGIKTSLMGGRLQINADAYYIDWRNLQVSLLANNFNFTGNAGAARIYGLEAEIAAKPATWLDVGGSLSLSNAALTKDAPNLVRTNGDIGVKDGDRLPGSPRSQGAVYAQLNFRYRDDTAFIRASGQYVGASYTDFASEGLRFGDYATADLRAGIVHRNVELTIFARNLLNSQGKQAAVPGFSIGPIVGADTYAYRIRPRTIGMTGRVAF